MKLSVDGKFRLAAALVLAAAANVPLAHAQEEGGSTELDAVTVTGSRITRATAETSSPVETLTREDIAATGKQNIAEILQTLTANGQGSIPAAFTSGFASGSAAVSLRGLGVNSTLVLINGRRSAAYGLADDGQRSFVDLNTIPLEAVERVEVLKDGASSIYGSDAIAGVVNIILRKDFQGASVGATAGTSYLDDGDTYRAYGTYGVGDLNTDGYNGFVTVEGSTQDKIKNTDRSGYLATNNLTDYGWYDNRRGGSPAGFAGALGSLVNPYGTARQQNANGGLTGARANVTACPEVNPAFQTANAQAPCLFDTAGYSLISPDQDRINVLGGGRVKATDSVEVFSQLSYNYSKVQGYTTPSSVTGGQTFNANSPSLFNPSMPLLLPADHPDNPFPGSISRLSYLTTEFGPRTSDTETNAERAVVGAEGALFGTPWKWGTGLTYSRVETKRTQNGFILFDAFQDAVNNGYRINNREANEAAGFDLGAISPTLKNNSTNKLYAADANVSGPLFSLPAGQVQVSLGGEFRKEEYDATPTPFTDTGAINGLGYSAFTESRKVTAAYAEILVPLHEWVELDGGVRYDHYDKYGNTTNPKVGLKFQPSEKFALRGTYSEGFRAPGPAEGGNAASFGFTGIANITAGNPDIKPETSKSWTTGLVVEPFKGTNLTVDYYWIKRQNEIIGADPATVLAGIPQTGTPGSQVDGALPNSLVVYDDQGDVTAIYAPYVNANSTKTDGLDVNLQHAMTFKDVGKFKVNAGWTHIFNFTRKLEDGTKQEFVGTHGPYVLSAAGGTPQDRGTLALTFERSNWEITTQVNYVSGMSLRNDKDNQLTQELDDDGNPTPFWDDATTANTFFLQAGQPTNCGAYSPDGVEFNGCHLGSFTTVDLFGKVDVTTHWTLTGSILNFLNREAPFDPYTYGGLNYNPVFHQSGAVGRFFTAGVKYTF